MKNTTFYSLIVSILVGTIFVPALAFASPIPTAPATDGANIGGAETAFIPAAPVTDGANIGGADTVPPAPATAGANIGGADSIPPAPATDGANIGGADSIPPAPATDGANIGGADTAVIPPVTPPATGGNTTGGGSTSGGSHSSGGTGYAVLWNNTTCPYLNSYLKFGANNSASEVTKLQTFLKNVEKIDVNINGIFDMKTVEAVKAFQLKYKDEIMAPWGITIPTGNVYFTTKMKIDEVYCNMNLSLTSDKLAEIRDYKNGSIDNSTVIENTDVNIDVDTDNTNNGSTNSPEVGQSNDNTDQTASVVKTSLWSRIWKAIMSIFRN